MEIPLILETLVFSENWLLFHHCFLLLPVPEIVVSISSGVPSGTCHDEYISELVMGAFGVSEGGPLDGCGGSLGFLPSTVQHGDTAGIFIFAIQQYISH